MVVATVSVTVTDFDPGVVRINLKVWTPASATVKV